MPRNLHPAPSTLRNRNRITNKTRLKIHQGSLVDDALLIPDEDEEKHRLTNLVAGVDAEDANEHHLQEVLSAVRNNSNNRASRGINEKATAVSQPAFIPTPDSTGVVDNYEELYRPDRWKDPATYVATSVTTEESVVNGLANGFTYYMDERDKEWLDKNNEEARGEGTSAQGAVSLSGTRTSARSAKAKGKEPEVSQPAVVSEDEFELVMGVLEKVTHERTEYLHHGLETGMDFPAFSEYQDVFSSPLPPATFATFAPPEWIPAPVALLRIARTVYPHWKERRVERGGHRIIPTLNGDESDTLNESYICFRRRETKAVRKTRASQVTSSDKLARLHMELSYPLELATLILSRETVKKELAAESQNVWLKRLAFADLKRKTPSFNDKADEVLLVDQEPVVKRLEPRVPGLKLRTSDTISLPIPRQEISIKPKERYAMIRDQIEATVARQKDLDHHWEDAIDNPYQAQPIPFASRFFKYIPPPTAPTWPSSSLSDHSDDDPPFRPAPSRPIRARYGRGGRLYMDRRRSATRTFASRYQRSRRFDVGGDGDEMDVDDDPQDLERDKRLYEQWKFDGDDGPAIGPQGSDEQDRELIDDYDTKYQRHTMTLFSDFDHTHLLTDPALVVSNSEGRPQMVIPYRLGMPPPIMRRDHQGVVRHYLPNIHGVLTPVVAMGHQMGVPPPSSTPVSMQQPLKKLPPSAAPQMRISSNGGMRPPVPLAVSPSNGPTTNHIGAPHPIPVPVPQHSPIGGVNGMSRAAISMPHVELPKTEVVSTPAIAPVTVTSTQPDTSSEVAVNGAAPARPKVANTTPQSHLGLGVPTNGFHLTPMVSMTASGLVNSSYSLNQAPHQHSGGLSLQQVQNLKSAFANMPGSELAALQNANRIISSSYLHSGPNAGNMNMQLPPGTNINLKLPASRQMQWANSPLQRPASVNGMDGPLNGGMVASPGLAQSLPVRSPSANGSRAAMRNGVHVNGQHAMSPHLQNSPTPLPNIAQSQSPPRVPMTPNMGISSPSLQHQQPVGTTQNGY